MKLHEKAIGIFDYIIGFLAVLAAVLLVLYYFISPIAGG